jgi:cytochrome b561
MQHPGSFGLVAIALHWVVALAVFGLFGLGPLFFET